MFYRYGYALIALALPACSVGPDYQQPEPELPERFAADDGGEPLATDGLIDWWKQFHQPELDRAIAQALESNHDLRVASARLRQVQSLRRAAYGQLGPQVGLGADALRSRVSKNTLLGRVFNQSGVDLTQNSYALGVDASWEIDLFGGVRRRIEAASARVHATHEQWRGIRLAIVGEVVRAFVERAGAARRLAIAAEQVGLQEQTLAQVATRVRTGIGRSLEQDQAVAQLQATRATLPSFRAARATADHRLAVLLGEIPGAKLPQPGVLTLPRIPDRIPLGLPGQLLRRRPDVRAAERNLAAATADIGVATAELYPKLFLFGGASLQSISTSDWLTGGSRAWQIGPGVRWRLFESGRIGAEIDGARAAQEAAVAQFEQSVLLALEDVESAAVVHQRGLERRQMLESATDAARSAARRARTLYDSGLAPFLTVLDAERRRNESEQALISSEIGVRLTAVALFQALGGGWQEPENSSVASNP